MPAKTTQCQICSMPRDPKLGAYCRPCYNRAAYIKKHGSDIGYKPYGQKSDNCAKCERLITQRHPNFRTLCHPCGVKRHSAYQKASRLKKTQFTRICKAEGCIAKVAGVLARYCAEHAPAARRAIVDRVRETVSPVVGQKVKQERERMDFTKPAPVVIPPHVRVTVCPPVAPNFSDYASGEEARPYQRRAGR